MKTNSLGRLFITILVIFINCLILPNTLQCQLWQYETKDLKLLYYDPNHSYIVPHLASCYENALQFHRKYWDYTPSEKVTILLNDFSDMGNGGTMVIPWNFLSIGIAPFEYTFDIMPANERMQWLMNHELEHVVMADKSSYSDKFFRKLFFGKVSPENENPITMIYTYLTTPRWYSPRWFHEGIAVFMETWMSGGMGRTIGGYDEMVFRTMICDSAYLYKVVGLESEGTTIDFQVGVNAYLYGTRIVSYLANIYGVDKLREFYSRTDSSSRFYASQFEKVFKNDVESEWDSWIKFEKEFQQKNLEKIREYPITKIKKILNIPLGSVSRSFYNQKERKLYAAVNYPGKFAHIFSVNIDNGKTEKISDVESPVLNSVTSLAYDESSNMLFESVNNYSFRGLRSVDALTGKRKELIEYTRTGDFAFNRKDKSLWGIKSTAGRTTIVEIPSPYTNLNNIFTIPYGKSFFDIDISPDGKYLIGTLAEVSGRQKLILFKIDSLLLGKSEYEEFYEFEDNYPSNFVFSKDGKYLYGTSYYTGVSNVYRINFETKQAEILTNAETGFFRPLPISEDSLIVFQYTKDGLLPGIIKIDPINDVNAISYLGQQVVEKNPVVKDWILPPPSNINIDSLRINEGKYNFFSEMKLASAYPVVEGYKKFLAYGMKFNICDDLNISSLNLTASYSPNTLLSSEEMLHLKMQYNYWDWFLSASYNNADFYDLFGPVKRSRKGYSIVLRYKKDILYDKKPKNLSFSVQGAAYGNLEKLPDYQNVNATFDKLFFATAMLNYSYLRKSLGAVEPEQGFDWKIFSYNSYVNNNNIPAIFSSFALGHLLPLRNSSLWLRTSVGNSFGDRDNPFSNFYFGSFGNNYIDHSTSSSGSSLGSGAQKYREMESFPGKKINEIGGKNFCKAVIEWNLTPIRFRKLGFLSFYSTYARFSLFGMGLATNIDDSKFRRTSFSTGCQLDFELVLFSLLKSTLSFGYARAYEKNFYPTEEFLISLKLL